MKARKSSKISPLESVKQSILVVDLEATCTETNEFPRHEMEIIEIGAILVDNSFTVIDRFQSFVKPELHPELTVFCKRLTKISQEDVNTAPSFLTVMAQLASQIDLSKVVLASWGDWDDKKWKKVCQDYGLEYPFTEHLNLRKLSQTIMGLSRQQGIATTCYILDMDFEGQEHRAIVDVENIVRIFQALIKEHLHQTLVV